MERSSRAMHPITFQLELEIARSPASVRRWWTEFPDDYIAEDPSEQPYRILTLRREGDHRFLKTFWKRPDGSEMEMEEVLVLQTEGGWTYTIERHPGGFHVVDQFIVNPKEGGGTHLVITSTLHPWKELSDSDVAVQIERMKGAWRRAVPICERDAPP